MKIKNFGAFVLYSLCLTAFGFAFVSCARIVTPKGGEKDVQPPSFVSSSPERNAINFKGNRIEINFDEYIALDNATDKLIVSPPLKNKPVIGSKLKTLYIKDLDSLAENTTYIFDFGDAVIDFTEGNRLNHFSFAFSTGNHIDTLNYEGIIYNAYTLKPEQAKYVALYSDTNRQYIKEKLPDYITKSDSSGRFYFQNIKEGDYLVLAFDDQNRNMLYDLNTEGFGTSTCKIRTAKVDSLKKTDNKTKNIKQTDVDSLLFNTAEDTIQKLMSAKLINNYELQIVTALPVTENFEFAFRKPYEYDTNVTITLNKHRDTVTVFSLNKEGFSTIKAEINDINGWSEKIDLSSNIKKKNDATTTGIFRFSTKEDTLAYFKRLQTTSPYLLNISQSEGFTAKIISGNDTMSVKFHLDNNNPKVLSCDKELSSEKEYTLLIDSNSVTDIRGFSNEKFSKTFVVDSPDDYGSFVITLKDSSNSDMSVILSLFDLKNNQIGDNIITKSNSGNQIFSDLKEGKYRLRLIFDSNGNGKWDKGDFETMRKPEKVAFFDKIMSVRKAGRQLKNGIQQYRTITNHRYKILVYCYFLTV